MDSGILAFRILLGLSTNISSIQPPHAHELIIMSERGSDGLESRIFENLASLWSPTAYLDLSQINSNPSYNLTSMIGKLAFAGGTLTVLINAGSKTQSLILQEFEKLSQQNHIQNPIQFFLPSTADDFTVPDIPASAMDINSDVYVVTQSQNEIQVDEVYAFKNITFRQRVEIQAGHTLLNEILRKAARRHNLQKSVLRAALMSAANKKLSYPYEINANTGEVKFIGGFRVQEFLYLRDSLNFTEIGVPSTQYADMGPDGKLIGTGKLIIDGKADVSVPSSEMVEYRLRDLTFLHPTSQYRLHAYFKQPPPNSFRDVYAVPFQPSVWAAYLAVWTTFGVAILGLHCIFRWANPGEEADEWGWPFEKLLLIIALVCQQGNFKEPKGPKSTRAFILVGLLSSMLLFSAYCASLLSTLKTPVRPIRSFEDILESRLAIYAEQYTVNAEMLLKTIQRNGSRPGDGLLVDTNTGFSKILSSKSAYVSSTRTFYTLIQRTSDYTDAFICDTVSDVLIEGPPAKSGMFLKKGSPLKEVFNYKILQMLERGIQDRSDSQYEKVSTLKCVKSGPSSYYKAPLGLRDVFTAFVILGLGMATSLLILIGEKWSQCLIGPVLDF